MSFAPYLGVPFSVCALGSVFFDEWIAADYERWSFSRGHIMHGWGCAFRGAGHDHLVSRRWLDFGPWRTIRLPEDTTFVQFHDLAITDPAEAYEVAKVGHERMGVSYTGGFIQQIDQWMLDDARGAYTAHDRKLHIVVADGVEVPQLRMLNAATLRRHYRLNPGEPEPVERIAFVFVHEGQARAHLHELWLRELECWVHDARGLRQVAAADDLAPIIAAVLAANPAKVAEYRGGKAGLLGFFVGQVMKASGGKANPASVNQLVAAALAAG